MSPVDIIVRILQAQQASVELAKIAQELKATEQLQARSAANEEERYATWLQHAAGRQETERRQAAVVKEAEAAKAAAVQRAQATAAQSENERYQQWLMQAAVRQEEARRESQAVAAASTRAWSSMQTGAQAAAKSVGLAKHEMSNLMFQIQDIGVMLSMGANPLTILATQGTQIYAILANSQGGVRGALDAISAKIAAMPAAPFAGWVTGIGAIAALAAAATLKIQEMLAKAQEAQTWAATASMNEGRGVKNVQAIEELSRQKAISDLERSSLLGENARAMGINTTTPEGAKQQAEQLSALFRRISKIREMAQGNDLQIEAAGARGLVALQKAMADEELATAKAAYDAREITLEQYLERRRTLVAAAATQEERAIQAEKKVAEAALAGASAESYSTAKARVVQLADELVLAEKRAAADLATVAKEGAELRQRELDKAAADEKERLREMEAFRKQQAEAEAAELARMEQKRREVRRAARDQFNTRTTGIQEDSTLTGAERYREMTRAAQEAADAGTITREELARFQAQLGPDPASWADQWSAGVARLADNWGTLQQNIAGTALGAVNSAIDGIAASFTNVLFITGRWRSLLSQIPLMIGMQIVQAIVKMGLQWVATQILMATVGKSIQAASVAATSPIAAAQSAIWATPATLATIASYGSAAAAAPGFIAAANAVTLSTALASFAGFLAGGYTGDGNPSDVAGVVHGKEFVFNARRTSQLGRGFLESLHNGTMTAEEAAAAGAASGGGMTSRGGETQRGESNVGVNVHAYGDISAAIDGAIQKGSANQYLLNLVDGRIRQFVPGT